MNKIDLCGIWNIKGAGYDTTGKVPGSVYSALLEGGLMQDPYYRDNELEAFALMQNDFTFSREFYYDKKAEQVYLVCEGLDSLCDIYVNEQLVEQTDNMHRTYRFDVSKFLRAGKNSIACVFHSFNKYVKEKQAENWVGGTVFDGGTEGFSHLRKAHCMSGWDWGPRLPDAGIWRPIYLMETDTAYITDFRIIQRHENGKVFVTVDVKSQGTCTQVLEIIAPNGSSMSVQNGVETEIENPQLWWPNGLGEQPLYTIKATLWNENACVDTQTKRIGLRTLELIRKRDEYGGSFYHQVNGVAFFAMGADYIPEDNIFSRITEQRTRKLLTNCRDCNFNAVRVWGGGYYPDDYFFEICDELGLVVFFDLMFACCSYPYGEEFTENVLNEIRDNMTRIRHHACLAVISGNNEIEAIHNGHAEEWGGAPVKASYIQLFERDIPALLQSICPELPYISSSPTSFGSFLDVTNCNYGDTHYWSVWHEGLPFTEYRTFYPRYLSEFGFQSFPCEKTVNAFTLPKDRNIFSRVMEMHQKNGSANEKILCYLAQNFLYSSELSTLLYASQLLQAEAIRYGVEHFRRNRGRCMGALYWQLNDIWPVASWSSIDYYGRYKALQYVAKRFYAPILISCEETGEIFDRFGVNKENRTYETKAKFAVTNDTLQEIKGKVIWKLYNINGDTLESGEEELYVPALSVASLQERDFNKTDVTHNYLWYAFEIDGKLISQGSVLFTRPKYFEFPNPQLTAVVEGDTVKVTAQAFGKWVEIDSPDSDFILSDNYFDMNAGTIELKILSGEPKTIRIRSAYDIR